MVVLDASTSLSWVLSDERTPESVATMEAILQNDEVIRVTAHWPYEVANGILRAQRRGRITADQAQDAREILMGLQVIVEAVEPQYVITIISRLAELYMLTVYDAVYLEMAMRHGCPLIAGDGALSNVAARAGVVVYAG